MKAKKDSFWKNINSSSLLVGAGCVLAGWAAATMHGNLEIFPATLCMFFAVFAQLSANMYSRYYDESHSLGVAIDRKISPTAKKPNPILMRECGAAMFLLSIMTGLALLTMGGWWILIVGIFIIASGWLCCMGEYPLMRSPYSPLCAFVLFGPVCVIATSVIQSNHEATETLSWFDISPALFLAPAMGLMAANSTIAYNFRDYYTHLRNSRISIVTGLGKKNARLVFLINSVIFLALMVACVIYFRFKYNGLGLIAPCISFLIYLYIWKKMKTLPRYKVGELVEIANINVFIMGLISFIVFTFTGEPDDSVKIYFDL